MLEVVEGVDGEHAGGVGSVAGDCDVDGESGFAGEFVEFCLFFVFEEVF